MIDFTPCAVNKFKGYGGANGNKINVIYQNESYMLKFPPSGKGKKIKDISYTNSCISEYIACHIFASMGFRTQETLLGTYTDKRGKEKIVVACKDFTADGKQLMEFAQLKNTCIDSEQNGYGKDIESVVEAMEEQKLLPEKEVKDFFWDMFIADAFLGNFDRHNGNWGFLVDQKAQTAEIAPIYDCGSCLYPQLAIENMKTVLENENEINQRIYVFPNAALEENGKKISYFTYISSLKNPDCNAALKRIYPKIDMVAIQKIIQETPGLCQEQRDFYYIMLSERKEKILDYSMRLLLKQEKILENQDMIEHTM